MSITRLTAKKDISANEVLVIGFSHETQGPELLDPAVILDSNVKAEILSNLKLTNFQGKKSETTFLTLGNGILCVGLGKISKTEPLELETLRRAAGAAARSLKGKEAALFALPTKTAATTNAVVLGIELGVYTFNEFKSKTEKQNESLKKVQVLVHDLFLTKPALSEAQIVANAINNVRDLVNTPPSHMTPAIFATYAKKSFNLKSKVSIDVLDDLEL